MELMTKQGYKQTEVGLIPEDWTINTIEELCKTFTKQTGFDYSNHIKPTLIKKLQRNTYPFIQNKDFDGSNVNFDTDYYIPCDVAERFPRILLNERCLLMSISGSIGKVGVFNNKQTGFIGGAVAVGKFKDRRLLDWVMHYLLSEPGQYLMLKDVKAGSHQNLILDDIRRMCIPMPTLTEQKAIATALTDVDELITGLEKLISKKKDIKQGAMQQLLTPPHKGGKRLPGFEGEWVEKTLGEVYNITKGQLITEKTRIDGAIPVIAGGKSAAYHHNKANRFGRTVTISGSGANAGYVSFHNYPIFASDCSTIEESKSYSIKFIYFFLKLKQNDIYNAQTGGAQPHIHPSDLNPMLIDLPENGEQQAIAQILSDMDREITQLETKKEKYQAIKQGMMQELLTGKTRLF